MDPARNGEGWTFSELIGPPGVGKVGLGVSYTYETDGKPSWLLVQGSWTRETDWLNLLNGTPIAVLNGHVFDGRGGSCPTCPWTEASIAQRRYVEAQVTFHRPDLATVKLDGETALSGEYALVPAELVVSRPLPGYFEGRWRFTKRGGPASTSSTRPERSWERHRCNTVATAIASPTSEHRFEAATGADAPYYLPPSGEDVQWIEFDANFTCTQGTPFPTRFVIGYRTGQTGPIRGIDLNTLTATTGSTGGTFPQTYVRYYTVNRYAHWFEVYLQDADTMIIRRFGNNHPSNFGPGLEMLLTRAPE
ncbi:MAG: hypothetical protein WCZ65_11940 [Lysobacteraceae bacterium]